MAHRVLSVQSSVVHGVVGNKAATFPLMIRGVEVDPLNTVQFSNHTGYKVFKGDRLQAAQFSDLIDGLRANRLLGSYSALLSGYVGNADILAELARVVEEVKAANPSTVFLCDPVCGDNGALYVKAEIPGVYRDALLSLADIVTPNGFEASHISGINVSSLATAAAAAQWFHDKGVGVVVITSFNDPALGDGIVVFASRKKSGDERPTCVWTLVPIIEGKFSGTGDLFSAAFLAEWLLQGPEKDLKKLVGRTVAVVQAVLRQTASVATGSTDGAFTELQLVAGRHFLVDPPPGPPCHEFIE